MGWWLLACGAETGVPLDPSGLPLVHAADLTYAGAFRLPPGTIGGSSFHYGGTALAFNPEHNSLFLVGHDWDQQVAEVAIPSLVNSANVVDLPIAPVLQPFTDVTEGDMYSVDEGSIKIGGLLVWEGELYGTASGYYDADGNQV